MEEIMRKLYYMIDEWAGQQHINDETEKALLERKYALEDEIMNRIGDGGQEMLEDLAELNLKIEDIHDKALFQAALRFGTEIRETAVS